MPELPDITLYLDALRNRLPGQSLEGLRLFSPFVLRSVKPPPADAVGKRVLDLRRLGKRIVIGLEDEVIGCHDVGVPPVETPDSGAA